MLVLQSSSLCPLLLYIIHYLFCYRLPSLGLCDPAPCGVPEPAGEPRFHFSLGSVCVWTLPPAWCPLSGRQPFWKAVSHSLQPAETIWPGPHPGTQFTGSGPHSRQPGPLPGAAAILPAFSAAVCCAAAGTGTGAAAAVSHQTSPAGGDGEKPATPPGSAAGSCRSADVSCVGL